MERYIEHRDVFPTTLVIKAIGSIEQIQTFVKDIQRLYPRQNLTFSHILKNQGNPGYHIFVNIILPSSNRERGEQDVR